MADITDGSSFTVMLGESLTGGWSDATSCCVRTDLSRTINLPIQVPNGSGGFINYYTYWMSKHPGIGQLRQVRRQRVVGDRADQ